jgi:hypothetical protein
MQTVHFSFTTININTYTEDLLIEYEFISDVGNTFPFIVLAFTLHYSENLDFTYINDGDRAILLAIEKFGNLKQLREYEKNHCDRKTANFLHHAAEKCFNAFIGGIENNLSQNKNVN